MITAYSSLPDKEELEEGGITGAEIITDINGVMFTRDRSALIRYPQKREGGYSIPDSVKIIWRDAFFYCQKLTSVTIPPSVVEIGDSAFTHCTGLTEIAFPASVDKIGYGAFSNCTGLTEITIPDTVVEIGAYAFAYCSELRSVTLPQTIKKIKGLFWECTYLPYHAELQDKKLKKEKVQKIETGSAKDWLNYLLKDAGYPFYVEEFKNKVTLEVKMNEKQVLEMHIFNKQFQTVIPKIMETIKRFEACIKESEIKVSLYDASRDSAWKFNRR